MRTRTFLTGEGVCVGDIGGEAVGVVESDPRACDISWGTGAFAQPASAAALGKAKDKASDIRNAKNLRLNCTSEMRHIKPENQVRD